MSHVLLVLLLASATTLGQESTLTDADSMCGVREGQAHTSVPGSRQGAMVMQECKLGTMMGQRVASICQGKVHSIQWNRVYTDAPLENVRGSIGQWEEALSDMEALILMLIEAGWVPSGKPETGEPKRTVSIWVKGTEERILEFHRLDTEGSYSLVRLSLLTTYRTPCTEGL